MDSLFGYSNHSTELHVSFLADYTCFTHFWLTEHCPVVCGWQISLCYQLFLPGGNSGAQLKETPCRKAVEELGDQLLNPTLGMLRIIHVEIDTCSDPKWQVHLQEGPNQGPHMAGEEWTCPTSLLANQGENVEAFAAHSRNGPWSASCLGRHVCLGVKSW